MLASENLRGSGVRFSCVHNIMLSGNRVNESFQWWWSYWCMKNRQLPDQRVGLTVWLHSQLLWTYSILSSNRYWVPITAGGSEVRKGIRDRRTRTFLILCHSILSKRYSDIEFEKQQDEVKQAKVFAIEELVRFLFHAIVYYQNDIRILSSFSSLLLNHFICFYKRIT